jgi:hypothetical protein
MWDSFPFHYNFIKPISTWNEKSRASRKGRGTGKPRITGSAYGNFQPSGGSVERSLQCKELLNLCIK